MIVLDKYCKVVYDVAMKDLKLVTQVHKIDGVEEEEYGSGKIIFETNQDPPDGFSDHRSIKEIKI